MKKILCILTALAIALTVSVGCAPRNAPGTTATPITTKAPATEAPATEAPATEAPATEAPVTEAPATEAPATEAPVTGAPVTEAPVTEAPVTEAPVTEAPVTGAPETEPEGKRPETVAPETIAPETEAPETEAPETEAPETEAPETAAPETAAPETEAPETAAPSLNQTELSSYSIVYGDSSLDYNKRAAEYIQSEILARTGIELEITTDAVERSRNEIVVGETNRSISESLDASTAGMEFALLYEDGSVALEGDYFVIAAAAYYFVEIYINDGIGNTDVPTEETVCSPITAEAENFIFLIGDGMGIYQTLLFEKYDSGEVEYSDGEDLFYGYLFPYMGYARTNSLSGVTDSAAAGTALASGYKTMNGYIGQNRSHMTVPSLTELAGGLGMATAVMSTEVQTGATPSSFSAHADSRSDTTAILASQEETVNTYGTIINCSFDYYNASGIRKLEEAITSTLGALSENENGFFLMYEEAHIDKHCHSNDMAMTFNALVRFNQAIALFMEYAFYNPGTFVLITADHETGNMLPDGSGNFVYNGYDHSPQFVPVFTYGEGGELFGGKTVENVQIPKTIAYFWGITVSGTHNTSSPALQLVK